jgi:hypothetical protein
MSQDFEDFNERHEAYKKAVTSLPRISKSSMVWSAETNRVSMSLNDFKALADLIAGGVQYGLKHPDNGNESVFPLMGTSYEDASDIAEKSGTLLMFRIDTEWKES